MTEKQIFEHLFDIAPQSSDTDGVVTSCLVRDGEIVADAVSAGVEHAEYALINKLKNEAIAVLPNDILYVTLQPCDRRSTPEGEVLGDCATNTIRAGIKNIAYAATYPKSSQSIERFTNSGVTISQVKDNDIIKQAIQLFNSTNENVKKHIPLPDLTSSINVVI